MYPVPAFTSDLHTFSSLNPHNNLIQLYCYYLTLIDVNRFSQGCTLSVLSARVRNWTEIIWLQSHHEIHTIMARKVPPKLTYFACWFFFSFLFWPPLGIWSSQAKDQVWDDFWRPQVQLMPLPDPLPTVPGPGSNLQPGTAETLPSLQRHNRNFPFMVKKA